jgi:adenine deaminase
MILLQRRIQVARGLAPGDLLLVGGQIVNVFTQRIEPGNVVVADGYVAGVGPYDWTAAETVDVQGQFVLPGLIDAHMHLESTLLSPAELARVVVPLGTTAIVGDPHEIGNVLGVRGIEMLLAASQGLPLDIFFMAPSCVPATAWEHAGATLGPDDVDRLLQHDHVRGLAEVMDFPAVLGGQAPVLRKILTALARQAAVDGHAPGLNGRELIAYVAAGIRSDHESTTVAEARSKAALGMLVQVRDGSSARNLETLLPLIQEDVLGDWCLATDDIHPDDLLERGHINGLLQRVISAGVPAARAVRHASLVPARHYGLKDRGAVAPGYLADLVIMADWRQPIPARVIKQGITVAREGRFLAPGTAPPIPAENTVHLPALSDADFVYKPGSDVCPVIGITAGQIVTRRETREVRRQDGCWVFDPARDVMLVASIERHRATGHKGLGLVTGFGFQKHAAIGSSVAHDSHNLVIAGTNPRDMHACALAIAAQGGGWVVVVDGQVRAQLALPIAGLLATASATDVADQLANLRQVTRQLGCPLPDPFGMLSFLALPVIPELRITDRGLYDVLRQEFVTT